LERRHCLDFGQVKDSQIGLLLPKSIQRIVVGSEVLRHLPLASNGLIEHSAECYAIHLSCLHAKPNDPTGVLIHDNQDPMDPPGGRFAPEQIETPEAVPCLFTSPLEPATWVPGLESHNYHSMLSNEDIKDVVVHMRRKYCRALSAKPLESRLRKKSCAELAGAGAGGCRLSSSATGAVQDRPVSSPMIGYLGCGIPLRWRLLLRV